MLSDLRYGITTLTKSRLLHICWVSTSTQQEGTQAEFCITPDQREKKAAKKAKTQGRLNFDLLLPSVTHIRASLVDCRVVKNKPQQSIIVSHRG